MGTYSKDLPKGSIHAACFVSSAQHHTSTASAPRAGFAGAVVVLVALGVLCRSVADCTPCNTFFFFSACFAALLVAEVGTAVCASPCFCGDCSHPDPSLTTPNSCGLDLSISCCL